VQVVSKDLVVENENFEKWTPLDNDNTPVEIYVEKALLSELERQKNVIIDAKNWNFLKWQKGMLFMKIEN
jgi:hypothetical protein